MKFYQVKDDPRKCERNLCSCVKKPEKNSGVYRKKYSTISSQQNPLFRLYGVNSNLTIVFSLYTQPQAGDYYYLSMKFYDR